MVAGEAILDPAIVADGASKLFLDGAVVAFHQLSLAVKRNEIMCVVGPSGCGKTTLLRCIAGLTDLSSGSLLVHGKAVGARPPDGVAMVFQHFGLLPWKTVFDNAAFGLAMAGVPRAEIKARVMNYLDLVGLTGFEGHYPYQLSGGMQQRVGLVRALVMNPSILLMDEPFAALDAQTREILQEELLALMERPQERKTMVFITHSIDEAILLGDRIAVMSARPHQGGARYAVRLAAQGRRGAVRPALRRNSPAHLAPASYRKAAPSASPERGCVTTVEGVRGELSDAAQPVDLSGDQARAERVAAARRHRRRLIDLAIRVVSLAIALALWEVAAWNVDPVLFTSPTKVAVAAYHMVLSGELWTYLWPSLVVLAIGFAFAVVLGIGIGLLLARFWVLDVALTVYITFLYSIPSVALVPLIVLWAGFDTTAKVIILFLFAFFPMVINTYQGVKSVDPKLLEVGRAFRCSERQLWWNIVLPASLPFIVTGLRLALGRGLIGMVLADLYTAISGIGYLIVRTASTYQVDKMFVPIVTLGLLGVTFTALLRLAERYVAPWIAASRDD